MVGQIIAAATRRFNRQGYVNTTMEDVAQDVHVLPGALYHYVRDKDELAFLCLKAGCQARARQLDEAEEAGVDGLEKVRRLVRCALRTGQSRMPIWNEVSALSPSRRDDIRDRIRVNNARLRRWVTEAMAEGLIVSLDPALTTLAIVSVLDWIAFWYTARLGYRPEQVAAVLDDLLAHGVYRRDLPAPAFPEANMQAVPPLGAFDRAVERRRDDILRAALTAFNKHGFPTASMDQIAGLAKVTRATVYRYFDNKEALLFEALKRADAFDKAGEALPEEADVVQQEIWIRRRVFYGHTTPAGPMRTYALLASLSPSHRAEVMERLELVVQLDLGNIERGIADGLYRQVDAYLAERFRSSLISLFPVWFNMEGRCSALEVADHHSRVFLFGLKPRPGLNEVS
jgi:AcrR family transcriptional regulator